MTSVEDDSNPILPHPFSLIVFSAIMFLLTLLSQITEPVVYERKWLIKRLLLSAIPPLLGIILSIRFYKEEKIKQRDQLFLVMSIIVTTVMTFLAIAYVLLLLLLYVGSSISGLSFYFLSVGIWGFVGITLGDSGIVYRSDIILDLEGEIEQKDNFTNKSSIFISRIFATSKNRILTWVLSFAIFLFTFWLISEIDLHPISVR